MPGFPGPLPVACTIECKSLAENSDALRRFDVSYFMISVDPIAENTAFAQANAARFPLLSDESKSTAADYGVLYQNRFALRHTFYIDQSGVIQAIDGNVNPQTSAQDMIDMLQRLDVPLRKP